MSLKQEREAAAHALVGHLLDDAENTYETLDAYTATAFRAREKAAIERFIAHLDAEIEYDTKERHWFTQGYEAGTKLWTHGTLTIEELLDES